MAYPVKIGSAEVLVNSLDEAAELIAKYQRLAVASKNGHVPQREEEPPPVDLAEFVADLPEWPQKGLRLIYQLGHGRPVGAENLRQNLGLKNNMELTGRVITPLVRHALRANIDRDSVFVTDRKNRPDGSTESVYSIPKDSLEAIKRGLGIQ
jgi:hypothetical protein